jgi:hypothetical protein
VLENRLRPKHKLRFATIEGKQGQQKGWERNSGVMREGDKGTKEDRDMEERM